MVALRLRCSWTPRTTLPVERSRPPILRAGKREKWLKQSVDPSRKLIRVSSANIDITALSGLIEDILAKDYPDGLDGTCYFSTDLCFENKLDLSEDKETTLVADELESSQEFSKFKEMTEQGNLIPLFQRVFSDQLTSVSAYRCLVKRDDRLSPSFLLESVVDGNQNGRFSFVGARPSMELTAKGNTVIVLDHLHGTRTVTQEDDPIEVPIRISRQWRPVVADGLPDVFTGGWVGYAGYDTVRYVYPDKLAFDGAPEDDRQLPDMYFGLYQDMMIFDNVGKVLYPAVEEIKERIHAGDIFQLVYSQRFERRTFADPFEIYRALRVVNPSPYMVYLQARSCVIVASSPEILCKVDSNRIVTNRPLAGTRPRGSTIEQDIQLQEELLADEKEKAEHIMLVDLGRNDVGKVAEHGTVQVEKLMAVERYSHVMHISSTVTGKMKSNLDSWDALRAALPAGTISGAPKVRAMQIIDEQEVNRRGPYGGGVGHVSFTGTIDMALALRTMVVPSNSADALYKYKGQNARREWTVHIQAGAGIVADSVAEKEYEETVNKAAALGRAIDLAEQAFSNYDD